MPTTKPESRYPTGTTLYTVVTHGGPPHVEPVTVTKGGNVRVTVTGAEGMSRMIYENGLAPANGTIWHANPSSGYHLTEHDAVTAYLRACRRNLEHALAAAAEADRALRAAIANLPDAQAIWTTEEPEADG